MNMGLGAKITIAASAASILGMFAAGVWTMSAAFHRLQVLEDDKSDVTALRASNVRLEKKIDDEVGKINNRISAQWPKVGANIQAINRLETWRAEVSRDVRENENRIDIIRDRLAP